MIKDILIGVKNLYLVKIKHYNIYPHNIFFESLDSKCNII